VNTELLRGDRVSLKIRPGPQGPAAIP
jgi:hypothetical protein